MGQEEFRFLDIKQTLWAPSAKEGKQPTRLNGHYSWPFEITLPQEVAVSATTTRKEEKLYKLPPSFTEKASPAYIDYRLIVTVKRGAFRVNQTYVPRLS